MRFRIALGVLVGVVGACQREQEGGPPEAANTAPKERQELLVFPDELRTEDDSVNTFVEQVMTCCASGDYERFRMLWSVREDPLSRDEYEEGWQAVRRINIRALQKVLLAKQSADESAERETAYMILADVELDPTHRAAKGEPLRQVVLLMRREGDQWRLSHPPKAMREWVKDRITNEDSEVPPAGP